jgi:16S rRNA G966 N2-methylase RsmD
MFLGSGTSAIEALNLGRRCVGVELKPDLVEYVRSKLPPDRLGEDVHLILGDSTTQSSVDAIRAALAAMGETHVHLLMFHPPYHDIIPFSDQPKDQGNRIYYVKQKNGAFWIKSVLLCNVTVEFHNGIRLP